MHRDNFSLRADIKNRRQFSSLPRELLFPTLKLVVGLYIKSLFFKMSHFYCLSMKVVKLCKLGLLFAKIVSRYFYLIDYSIEIPKIYTYVIF